MRVIYCIIIAVSAFSGADDLERLDAQELRALVRQLQVELDAAKARIAELEGRQVESASAAAVDLDPDILIAVRDMLEGRERSLKAAIRAKQDEIKAIRRNNNYATSRARGNAIRQIKAQIDRFEEDLNATRIERYVAPPFGDPMIVGAIGQFRDLLGVQQIIDANNVLVHDATHTRPLYPLQPSTIWIRGVDTSTFADGEDVYFRGTFVVTGTTRYTTVSGGSRTVYVAEVIDLAPYLAYIARKTATGQRP